MLIVVFGQPASLFLAALLFTWLTEMAELALRPVRATSLKDERTRFASTPWVQCRALAGKLADIDGGLPAARIRGSRGHSTGAVTNACNDAIGTSGGASNCLR